MSDTFNPNEVLGACPKNVLGGAVGVTSICANVGLIGIGDEIECNMFCALIH